MATGTSMSRYVLVDYLHLAHRCVAAAPLSAPVMIGSELQTVDTTIPNYTIKNIYKSYGGRGLHYTGVFLEGGNGRRKNYFKNQLMPTGKGATQEYKGGRPPNNSSFYQGVDLAVHLMANGKVSLYRQEGHEADDCIISMVKKIKSLDTQTPIDVITGDSDLLALVDDQVSVYMRGNRQHAEPNCPEHRLYFQVTPETWEEYLSYSSAYRDYYIPFNSMLLFKMIRGDKTDNITGALKGYGGKKYSALMYQMVEDGVDFPNIFRYGVDFDTVIRPVLENYFKDEMDGVVITEDRLHLFKDTSKGALETKGASTITYVDYMKFIYNGINPEYVNLSVPKQIELGFLQKALNPVKINLI